MLTTRKVVSVLVLVLVSAIVASHAGASDRSTSITTADVSAKRPTLEGRWTMRFTTISNRGFVAPKVGTRTTRTWLFERRCASGRCRLVARREFREGYKTLRVSRRGSLYVVRYKTRAPCRNSSGTFPYSERITFTISSSKTLGGSRLASKLTGRLVGSSPAQGCQETPGRAVDRLRGERVDLPEPPEAAFEYGPESLSVTAGATAFFTDASSDDGEIQGWAWDFGDPGSGAANQSRQPNPSHMYTKAGTYRVTLTVTDDEGLTDTTSQLITVSP